MILFIAFGVVSFYTIGSILGGNILAGFEGGIGTAFGDTLEGTGLTNHLFGGSGNDALDGLAGADSLEGGAGVDQLIGGSGADTLRGGDDGDIRRGGVGTDRLDGGDGEFDVADYTSETADISADLVTRVATGAGTDTLAGIERLEGGSGNDTLAGDDANNVISGGLGNDELIGRGGDDLFGVESGDGDDTIDGGLGNDKLLWVGAESLGNFFNLTNSGATEVASTPGGTLSVTGVEQFELVLGDKVDLVDASASTANFFVRADGGEDRITTGSGSDTIVGGTFDDTLAGGAGSDHFVYESDDWGDDLITDFQAGGGGDVLDFSQLQITFGDLLITDDGGDALVDFAGQSIRLQGIDPLTMNEASNFDFG